MARTKKKAQMFDQIFIYILMLIIFLAILIFGFVAIKKILDEGEKIEASKFQSTLKNLVDSNIHYGTTQVEVIRVPGSFKEICFIDGCVYKEGEASCAYDADAEVEFGKLNMDETGVDGGEDVNGRQLYDHPRIKNSIEGLAPNNVFIYPNGADFYIGELEVVANPTNGDPSTISPAVPDNPSTHPFYDCMPISQNQIQIRFEGLGNKVRVTFLPFKR